MAGENRKASQMRTAPRIMVGAKGLEQTQFAVVQPHRQFEPQVAAARREEQTKIGVGQNPPGTGLKIHSRDIQRRLGINSSCCCDHEFAIPLSMGTMHAATWRGTPTHCEKQYTSTLAGRGELAKPVEIKKPANAGFEIRLSMNAF